MSWIRTFAAELHAWQWLGILTARLVVGSLFFLSGRGKLFIPERREQMRQTLIEAHVLFPEFNALFVSAVELVCGMLLVQNGRDAALRRPHGGARRPCQQMRSIIRRAFPPVAARARGSRHLVIAIRVGQEMARRKVYPA